MCWESQQELEILLDFFFFFSHAQTHISCSDKSPSGENIILSNFPLSILHFLSLFLSPLHSSDGLYFPSVFPTVWPMDYLSISSPSGPSSPHSAPWSRPPFHPSFPNCWHSMENPNPFISTPASLNSSLPLHLSRSSFLLYSLSPSVDSCSTFPFPICWHCGPALMDHPHLSASGPHSLVSSTSPHHHHCLPNSLSFSHSFTIAVEIPFLYLALSRDCSPSIFPSLCLSPLLDVDMRGWV